MKAAQGVRPCAGIEAAFQKRLDLLVAEMHNSLVYWLTAAYNAKPPEMATDAKYFGSPAMVMRRVMRSLSRRWIKRFDEAAPKLAEYFSKATQDRSDRELKRILKDAGIAIEFKMTARANDVLRSVIGEQVSLIKSIASEHLSKVEGAVMRSMAVGGDLKSLTDELGPMVDLSRIRMGRKPGESDKSLLARTRRRAAFIAQDQLNKANSAISTERCLSIGLEKGQWVHSHGSKVPRPSHLKASDEKLIFDLKTGAFLDGEYVMPHTLPNCHCFYKPVIPSLQEAIKIKAGRPKFRTDAAETA